MEKSMDDLDREILNEIQWTFPLVSQPYHEIAKKFNVSAGASSDGAVAVAEAYFEEKGVRVELVDGEQLASVISEQRLRPLRTKD